MSDSQKSILISNSELFEQVHHYKDNGYRLVQICCTALSDGIELNYSFAKEYVFVNLKFKINPETEINSISSIYEPAFLYENEMHDLFGVKIKNISIDYKGELYKLAVKTPFSVPLSENVTITSKEAKDHE